MWEPDTPPLSELCIENIPKKNNVGNKSGIPKEV